MSKTPAPKLPFPMRMLLVATFFMSMGGFMVVPFLVVYLTNTLGFSPWELGTVLTINLLLGRSLPLFTGILGDRISHSTTILLGVLTRGIGFVGYAYSHQFSSFVVASALVGIGGALYSPSVSAVFAKQPEEDRKRVFTYYNQSLNAGTILGPLAGGALIQWNPTLPFSVGGILFLLLSAVLFFYRKQYETERTTSKILESIRDVFGDRSYMIYVSAMILFWIVFTQLNVSWPILAFRVTNNESFVSWVYFCNGLTGIGIMFLLRKSFEKRPPLQLLRRGVLLISAGMLAAPWYHSMLWVLACVLVYTIGETYALPASDLIVSESSSHSPHTGAYFGMYGISTAIGGTIGNYLGAFLMAQKNEYLPWISYAVIGLLMFVALVRLGKKNQTSTKSLHV